MEVGGLIVPYSLGSILSTLTVDITITTYRRETEAEKVTLFMFTQNYEVVKPESKYGETKVIVD